MGVILPELRWVPTGARGLRYGHPVNLLVVHRWGVRYTTENGEAHTYQGVIRYFLDPLHQASAHIVFPGSAAPGEATQMVRWAEMAWTEAAYNPDADDVESADACWLPNPQRPGEVIDEQGLHVLARIVADRLLRRGLPPVWSHVHGFCRHADLGMAGGDHPDCPTTDLALWRRFSRLVSYEYHRGGFRDVWGR